MARHPIMLHGEATWPCALLAAALVAFAHLAGCSRNPAQKAKSGDKAHPGMTFVLTCKSSAQIMRIPVDPENPVPGLLELSDAIKRVCKPNAEATAGNPVEIASLVTELAPYEPAALNSQLPKDASVGSRGRATMDSMAVSASFRPVSLVQFAQNRFAWGSTGDQQEGRDRFLKLHPDVFGSPGEATRWLGEYYADVNTAYRVHLAVHRDGIDLAAGERLEADLRASQRTRGEAWRRNIVEHNERSN